MDSIRSISNRTHAALGRQPGFQSRNMSLDVEFKKLNDDNYIENLGQYLEPDCYLS